jgi:hypothetical protein
MTTTASDLPAAAETNDSPTASIAFWVLAAKVTSETGVFNCEQAGFWFPEWQEGEREADEDIRLGRYQDFETREDLMDYLDKL